MRVWKRLGEQGCAEGLAWIHRTMQGELAPKFHAIFHQAVAAQRELPAG